MDISQRGIQNVLMTKGHLEVTEKQQETVMKDTPRAWGNPEMVYSKMVLKKHMLKSSDKSQQLMYSNRN